MREREAPRRHLRGWLGRVRQGHDHLKARQRPRPALVSRLLHGRSHAAGAPVPVHDTLLGARRPAWHHHHLRQELVRRGHEDPHARLPLPEQGQEGQGPPSALARHGRFCRDGNGRHDRLVCRVCASVRAAAHQRRLPHHQMLLPREQASPEGANRQAARRREHVVACDGFRHPAEQAL